jgi:hypothetical protein
MDADKYGRDRRKLMIQTFRRLNVSAAESHLGIALVLSAVTTGLMLWTIIWHSDLMVFQRDLIR